MTAPANLAACALACSAKLVNVDTYAAAVEWCAEADTLLCALAAVIRERQPTADRTALFKRVEECLPTMADGLDARVWCSVRGDDLRALLATCWFPLHFAAPQQEQDAINTLVEEGWTWDGDQWQRPCAAPIAAQPADTIHSDIDAILYQCDRGNVSLPWLIDALHGLQERYPAEPKE